MTRATDEDDRRRAWCAPQVRRLRVGLTSAKPYASTETTTNTTVTTVGFSGPS